PLQIISVSTASIRGKSSRSKVIISHPYPIHILRFIKTLRQMPWDSLLSWIWLPSGFLLSSIMHQHILGSSRP
ncbi:MAG: hypothetical protein MUP16_06280, partial [Sedimentisphaerales bacterium]|nr:hypothetical protein [Sedimentisphaerales bacterium]